MLPSLKIISQTLELSVNELCINELHHILAKVMLEERHALKFFLDLYNSGSSSGNMNIGVVKMIRSCSLDLVKKLTIELGNLISDVQAKVGVFSLLIIHEGLATKQYPF